MQTQVLISEIGKVVEVIGENLCRVELSNGYRLLGFFRISSPIKKHVCVGAAVVIKITPFDPSVGKVCGLVDCSTV